MMNSIFSMFDPMNKFINPFIVMLILMIKFPLNKEKKKNKMLNTHMTKTLNKEMKSNSNPKMKMNFLKPIIMFLFMMILMLNILSLTPFSWSMTSQPTFNIPSIMSIMMLIIMISLKKNKNLLIHFTPPSTPMTLIPFMVVIETISWLARPLTLILRLTANMISGHILMFLLGKITSMSNMKNTPINLLILIPLILLEMMVSIIQAYILFTLMTLYLKET